MSEPKKRAADRAGGALRWNGNSRVILMQLWISKEPEHLVSRLVAALEINDQVIKYHLRLLMAHGYVTKRKGNQTPLPQFRQKPLPQFDGLRSRDPGEGFLSAADLWSITEKGKAKASALAAERESN